MIRNVIVHVLNEQPLMADLFGMPAAGDTGLVCTNLRTVEGRRPIFIERSDSTFFFPFVHLRFVEMPSGQLAEPEPREAHAGSTTGAPDRGDDDSEIDEAFLRRIRDA